jgi:hypothetical protein
MLQKIKRSAGSSNIDSGPRVQSALPVVLQGQSQSQEQLSVASIEMLVMAQYNIARHRGVEAMAVSMFSMTILV